MTEDEVVIYLISVNGEPKYVGSSKKKSYRRRISDHKKNDNFLKDVNSIKFEEIQLCSESDRYFIESFFWKEFVTSGAQLENKRDPINAWPLNEFDRNEAAKIIANTRRKNGSYNPWPKANINFHERSIKSAKTRKNRGVKVRTNGVPGGLSMKGKKKSESHRSSISLSRKIMAFARKNGLSYEEAKIIWLQNRPDSPPGLLNRGTVEEL